MSRPVTSLTYEVDDGPPASIRIVPGDPVPEMSGDGTPTVMLYISGDSGVLNLGARWWPAESELGAVRKKVAAALNRGPAEFLITADAVRVVAVSLLLADGPEQATIELGRSVSSGAPPFTALFSAAVGGRTDAARRACSGETGLLFVEVEAELTQGRSATTTLAAQLGLWVAELDDGGDDAALATLIDRLVADGTVRRTRSAVPDTDATGPDLVAEADRSAAGRFRAAVLATRAQGAAGGTVGVAVTAHRPEQVALVRRADVGRWLRGSSGRHVLVAAGGPGDQTPVARATARRVEIGFATDGAPLAQVELSGSGEPVVLVSPFAATTIAADDKLDVVTRYADSGPSYRVTLPLEGDGWRLSPADLGLVAVSVDATRLRAAGATAVQADVYYQPEDRGTPAQRTVRFTADTWRADWFVVSRGPDLAGQLLVNLTVTPDDLADVPASARFSTATVRL